MWFRRKQSQSQSSQQVGISGVPEASNTEPGFAGMDWRRREIQLVGMIDDEMANRVIAQLLYLQMQDKRDPITLVLNSEGGAVTAALAIMDTMEFVGVPIHVAARELAAGMALLLLAAGTRGQRVANAHSLVQCGPVISTSVNPGTHELFVRIKAQTKERLRTLTNLTALEAEEVIERGRSFTPVEALDAGIIDTIAPSTWTPRTINPQF
ncbi:ATP-dependent Clp protease proteolytic subunit [Verrucomicrobium sp. BvORR034]|uniref:ATP-dependent Clp protease proteolytic subunit n=1 Tax=Verrucomicrobium sp. BvORR034 TaxID=1396418 RepID=UPI0009DE11C5|nr:ATP-dependent Clp protease proteolytic subunit [Verrucomicrobium sp. BvORR034]